MTRAGRLRLVTGVSAGVLLVAAGVAFLVAVGTGWFREKVRQRIVREVEEATGGRAEIGAFAFDPRALRAEVRDFVLHGTEAPGAKPLFRARRVEVGLKVISILRRDIDIASLTVEAPEVRVVVYPDGRTNLPRPPVARQPRRNAVEEFLSLEVKRFAVENGTVEWASQKLPLELRGENLRARLAYDASGPAYRGEVAVRALSIQTPAAMLSDVALDAAIALEKDQVRVSRARLKVNSSWAQVEGWVESFESPRAHFSFRSQVAVADLAKHVLLPVRSQGSAVVTGKLQYAGPSDYHVAAQVAAQGLAIAKPGVAIDGIGLRGAMEASPGRIRATGLRIAARGAEFTGTGEIQGLRTFGVSGHLKNLAVGELARIAGASPVRLAATISGPVHAGGGLSGGSLFCRATLALTPAQGATPLTGSVDLEYGQAAKSLNLGRSWLSTPESRVEFEGNPDQNLRFAVETKQLDDLLAALAALDVKVPAPLPVRLQEGVGRFEGDWTGGLSNPRINAKLSFRNAVYEGTLFERGEAVAAVSPSEARLRNVTLERGALRLTGEGRIGMRDFRPRASLPLEGSINLRNAELKSLLPAGYDGPVIAGIVSGSLKISGPAGAPDVRAAIQVERGSIAGQDYDRLRATAHYAGRRLEVPSAQITVGASRVTGALVFEHTPDDWRKGRARWTVAGEGFPLTGLPVWKAALPESDGRARAKLGGEAEIDGRVVRLLSLDGRLSLYELTLEGRALGDIQIEATTQGRVLELRSSARLAGAKVTGTARWQLERDYPARGELQFQRLALSTLRRWWARSGKAEFPVEALAEGKLLFEGRGLNLAAWKGRAEIPLLEIKPRTEDPASKLEELGLRNAEPVVIEADQAGMRIVRARLLGRETNLEVSGKVLVGGKGRYELSFRGGVDLAILHEFERDLAASGNSVLDAELRGPLADPGFYGRLALNNASLYFSGVPNGIDKANGTVFFDRNRATIESLTAETGGGKLALAGFIGFGSEETAYRLQATADQVRVRYPEGVSTTLNASLNLSGTSARSLLSGVVRVVRAGINPRMDFSGLLAQSSQPVVTPAIRNELLRSMQFDVRIETAPNARLDTSLTRDIQVEANLRLRGGPARPILLGRISATQGEVNFFGNKYNIGRGEISFLNPAKLEPVVNLDLETRIRGVEITVNLAGPPNKLNMTYRSDPPLQLQEVIALMTVGRAPSYNPAVAVRQFDTGQDWQQVGAGALLGQALATPVTGRLQRFFGVSRIKIDPQLRGVDNNPQARLTVEQQISQDITFTYITNLNKGQQQIVGLEWSVNKQWSIQTVREENGLFGIEFLYRRQFK